MWVTRFCRRRPSEFETFWVSTFGRSSFCGNWVQRIFHLLLCGFLLSVLWMIQNQNLPLFAICYERRVSDIGGARAENRAGTEHPFQSIISPNLFSIIFPNEQVVHSFNMPHYQVWPGVLVRLDKKYNTSFGHLSRCTSIKVTQNCIQKVSRVSFFLFTFVQESSNVVNFFCKAYFVGKLFFWKEFFSCYLIAPMLH